MFSKRIIDKALCLGSLIISGVLVATPFQINPVIPVASASADVAASRDVDTYSERESAVERAATKEQVTDAYARLPLSFEPNRGQTNPTVKFLARGARHKVFLTGTEVVLGLSSSKDGAGTEPFAKPDAKARESAQATVTMKMLGANPAPSAIGVDELPGKSNYFLGSDPAKWVTKVPTFSRVRFSDVYPGVEMVYYGNQQQMEYDFVVAPGIDPEIIRLEFSGARKISVDGEGSLVLETALGEVRQQRPVIYQEVDGVRREVSGCYLLVGRHCAGFKVGSYDTSKPLVIDPVLVYSSFLGGSRDDAGSGIAIDSAGAVYLTGSTSSHTFPTSSGWGTIFQPVIGGPWDAFVTKLNPAGSEIVYSTFLGGSSGDGASDIAIDNAGNAYVAGNTGSWDFPTFNAFRRTTAGGSGGDGFVTKLNSDGSALVYSTYIGGPFTDYVAAIAVDPLGSAYITGQCGGGFPIVGAVQPAPSGGFDSFVSKLNPAGSELVFSTYLGGSREDVAADIAVDSAANVYVAGQTESADFPTRSPLYASFGGQWDAFVTKINSAGTAFVFSTFLGGSAFDGASSVAVDSTGSVYVAGSTQSTDFPTRVPLQPGYAGGGDHFFAGDGFVTKLNPSGSALVYSTYFGASGSDCILSIAVNRSGNLYVAGRTNSTDFPTVNPVQLVRGGGFDAFLAKLNPTGTLLVHSTFFGGSGDDAASEIALDLAGNVYMTGGTSSSDFPRRNPFQPSRGGGMDGFVAKFADETSETACFVHRVTTANTVGNTTYIDHPLAYNANALVFITPNWNPGGVGAVYNNHHTGVWFDGLRWAIFNQDSAAMPIGASFNVVIQRSPNSTNFTHQASSMNIVGHYTYVDHPLANGNPNAILTVTPNWNPRGVGGVFDDSAIGVWYDGSRWAVFNQDFRWMTVGAAFNVSITRSASSTELIHQASSLNISGHYTYINDPRVNGNANAILLVTPNWNPGGAGGVFDFSAIGVWYTGSRWAIFNQNSASMSPGTAFNVRICN